MPRLPVEIDDHLLNDDELRQGFSNLASDNEAMRLVRSMLCLMKEGRLAFWLSPQLMRKLKAFAVEQQGESNQGTGEIDAALFLSWLQQGGGMEPNLRWEVESLPNNGGIYGILLKGGRDEKGADNKPS